MTKKIVFCLNLDELTDDGVPSPEFVETLFTARAEPAFDVCIVTQKPLYEVQSALLEVLTRKVGAEGADEIIKSTKIASTVPEGPKTAVFGRRETGSYYLNCRDATDPDNVKEHLIE